MTGAASSAWERASLAAALLAVDPSLGAVLRGGAGAARDAWLGRLGELIPAGAPWRRLAPGVGDAALMGGLDLAATLRAGKPVAERGVLAQADGGVVVLAMAERLPPATAARIACAIDVRTVVIERDGFALRSPANFGVVALDEGQGEDESPPAALIDRLAFRIDLDAIGWRDVAPRFWRRSEVSAARARLACVGIDDSAAEALVAVAARLGVDSLRAPLQALRAARALCALRGGEFVEEADVATAAQLVLAPRATAFATPEAPERADPSDAADPPAHEDSDEAGAEPDDGRSSESPRAPLSDLVLAAAAAALPPGLFAQVASAGGRKGAARAATAAAKAAARRGRPVAARRGALREGRLALVDTLRAAAPWQALRRKQGEALDGRRVLVRAEDFRIVRFRARDERTAVFVVDASGSAAAQRLAEVKGAIELLLADCYVRRDSVALVAFRGVAAEVVLPPTRSLARAKRTLSGLPGGGGTPLAAGLDAALALADGLRRKGRSPLLVLMTDGRANIARDGTPGRARALADALGAAARVRAAGIAALAIDASPLTHNVAEPPTERLGRAMNAHCLKLPNADAARVCEAVRAAAPGF